ncbi:transcriptional regulator TrmB [Streptomyces sp. NRRL F-4489]|uniref:helix-turn-helix domain-containing protein n=1 Tax=Streptomyces sp. NRRL F-4489 TaxID=1609095 RepID=UPI000749DA8B|nr:helix-turn-helix domain-containing protein [Streptomyces sp. NRRL F-4489]KUL46066.1 transcriptional regulator TrmB [Streptomyces sp. NRRL F-4489]
MTAADDDRIAHLVRLGLSGTEAGAYLAMLDTGPTTVAALARRLGRTPADTELVLAGLVRLGLAASHGPDRSGVAPIEPSLGLGQLANARTAELQRAHLAAMDAYRTYRRQVHPQTTDDLVEVVTGPQIVERILQIEDAAASEVLRFDSPPWHTGGTANPTEIRNLERGVSYRVVYSKSAVGNGDYYARNIRPCIAAGEEARVLQSLPVKLGIFDQRLALVSMTFGDAEVNDSLLLVRPSSLLRALTGLFETSWRSAYPLHFGARVPPALRPVQRRILELLGTGVTDETIAELLGISRRTLSRQLEQLNRAAGATTRFQLALYAARKGWI